MASTSDIRKGLCIKYSNDIYKIIEFLHVKPGKGPAFVRTKLKSVTTGKVIDNTFASGHKIDDTINSQQTLDAINIMFDVIRDYTNDNNTKMTVSLSGGRKNITSTLSIAFQLFLFFFENFLLLGRV